MAQTKRIIGNRPTTEAVVAAKKRFLTALELTGNVSRSALAAGINRNTAMRWRQKDEQFALDWYECEESGVDAIEEVAVKRALSGESDTMLIFMLKSKRRERYGDQSKVEHSGSVTMTSLAEMLAAR